MKEYSIFIFYHKNNRNSFRAILGSLDKYELIQFFDFYFPTNFKELSALLKEKKDFYKQMFLMISLMTSQFIGWANRLEGIKAENLIKMAGGPHPSGLPLSLNVFFDFVFYKEAEVSLPEFLRNFVNNRNLMSTPGIIYWKGQKLVVNKHPGCVDINDFPPFSKRLKRYGPLEITRGCFFECKYCQTPYLMGKKVRHRKVDIVLKWIEEMFKSGMKDIRFITPNALSYGSFDRKKVNKSAIYELVSGIRNIIGKQGRIFFGSFPSEVRPDYVDEDLVEIVSKFCDNESIVIGSQSGSDRILELINRGHTVEDVIKAVNIIKKHGLVPVVDFIIGLPEENEEDMRKTIDLSEMLIEKGAIAHMHYFMPLPGTPFWGKKPVPVGKNILSWIGRYSSKGKIFGSIEKQYQFSRNIYDILREIKFAL